MEGEFSYDLDAVWVELGYCSKQFAVKALKENLVKDTDYKEGVTKTSGRARANYYLTEDAYKKLFYCTRAGALRLKLINQLKEKLNGEASVLTPSTVIVDLVTDNEFIVIEEGADWIKALGKIDLTFRMFENKTPTVYLYQVSPRQLKLATEQFGSTIQVKTF